MSRPPKCRNVCRCPKVLQFTPVDSSGQEPVLLTMEEYETLRLIDREGFSQERCGKFMAVARTTVQQIYANARKKLAEALVDGRPLHIDGGSYHLCDHSQGCGGVHNCQGQG